MKHKLKISSFLFLAPLLIMLAIFSLYPIVTTLYVIFVATLSAYLISRFRFKGKRMLLGLVLAVSMLDVYKRQPSCRMWLIKNIEGGELDGSIEFYTG